jgi:energy-coupling factor transporter ATP-binding protein EcfA2
MKRIDIKGLSIQNVSPIIDQVLELKNGVNILYGKNGVGKSRILNVASYASDPQGESPGGFSITFKYPAACAKSGETYVRSPWSHLERTYPSHYQNVDFEPDFGKFYEEFQNSAKLINESTKWQNGLLDNLAFYIYTLTGICKIGQNDEEILYWVRICYEIANVELFEFRFREQGVALKCIAPRSDETPMWNALLDKASEIRENEELIEQTYGNWVHESLMSWADEAENSNAPWLGAAVLEIQKSHAFKSPVVLIDENKSAVTGLTYEYFIDLVKMSLHSELSEESVYFEKEVSLLEKKGDYFQVNPIVVNAAHNLSNRATEYFQLLMDGAPNLVCKINSLQKWESGKPIEWVAQENYRDFYQEEIENHELEIEKLSNAQRRWAEFSVKLAMVGVDSSLPLLIVLDEPEAGLHRRAERQLAKGINEITNRFKAKCLLATHSPTFLNDKSNNLIHVSRENTGNTRIETMSNDLIHRLDDYGIDRSDLLQFCKTFVIVEGIHDAWVLDELFQQEFQNLGVEVLALRGLTKLELLSALDAQFLFRFTTSDIVICFDNDETKSVQDIWERACAAKDAGSYFINILDELNVLHKSFGKSRDEYKMIHDFCIEAINENSRGRVKFHSLTKSDIIEYFSPQDFVKLGINTKSFDEYRKEHEGLMVNPKSGTKANFKTWLTSQIGAEYSEKNVRNAVRRSDSIHQDFIDLLSIVS